MRLETWSDRLISYIGKIAGDISDYDLSFQEMMANPLKVKGYVRYVYIYISNII